MTPEGRGKLRRVSCTGGGVFYDDGTEYDEVEITVTRIN
jgi:hypothetical protein